MAIFNRRVLLLGATGMLGGHLLKMLQNQFTVLAPLPRTADTQPGDKTIHWLSIPLNAAHPLGLEKLLEEANPDFIINCIAITPQSSFIKNTIACISVNSLFPHYLAKTANSFGYHLIHISTDGVFSGRQGNYAEDDLPDPPDLYGCSKLLGEVTGKNCLTIRTTFFGPSPTKRGLVEWLLAQRTQTIKGYKNYIFSGLSLTALGREIIAIIKRPIPLTGLYHVGGPAISKYDLLRTLSEKLQLNITIDPVWKPAVNRSLNSTRFYEDMQMELPFLEQIINDVKNDIETKNRQ